jgi:hypothetical protein
VTNGRWRTVLRREKMPLMLLMLMLPVLVVVA